LAGPPDMFSLNPSAGPRVSLTHCFSSSRETVALHPAPVRRSAAATPAPPLRCRTRAAPAPLRRRATRQRSRTRRACARATASHVQRRRFAAPPHARSSAPLPYSSRSKGSVPLPTPLDQAHSRCSRNCLLGFFFDFFPDLQGYDLYTLLQSEIPLLHHPLHTCLHISLP